MRVSSAPFTCDGTCLGQAGSRGPGVRGGQLDTEVGSKVQEGAAQGRNGIQGLLGGWALDGRDF